MHELQFSAAARPEPVIILGLLLRPYSLGHELCLLRENNPLVEKEIGTPVDLAQAVWICHQGWEENQNEIRNWLYPLQMWIWRTRLRFTKINFKREFRAFAEYRESGSLEFPLSGIPRPDGHEPSRPLGSPFLLCLHLLLRRIGLSITEAWNYPYGLAKMEWQGHWELEGSLRVWNIEDAAHEEARQKWEKLRSNHKT